MRHRSTASRCALVLVALLPASAGTALAQSGQAAPSQPGATPATQAAPAAKTADVASIDAIVAAVYDTISGPARQARDWNRFRGLFREGARLIPTGVTQDGTSRIRVGDVEDYVSRSGPVLEKRGFFEREIARKVERYGSIAHVFSTYESRSAAADPKPFARGINSIQLYFDGTRWWVVTIMWDQERPGHEIPAAYLPGRR